MKSNEVAKMSKEELQDKLAETRKVYSDMKMAHTVSPLDNPIQLKKIRRDIARLMTALNK